MTSSSFPVKTYPTCLRREPRDDWEQHNMALLCRLKAQVMPLSFLLSPSPPHLFCPLPHSPGSCLSFSSVSLLHHCTVEFISLPFTCWELAQTKQEESVAGVMGSGIMLTPQHPTIIENASVSLNPWETGTAEIPSDNAAPL